MSMLWETGILEGGEGKRPCVDTGQQPGDEAKKRIKRRSMMKTIVIVNMVGWEDTGERFAGLEIWRQGNQRRLLNPQTGEVVHEYSLQKEVK